MADLERNTTGINETSAPTQSVPIAQHAMESQVMQVQRGNIDILTLKLLENIQNTLGAILLELKNIQKNG